MSEVVIVRGHFNEEEVIAGKMNEALQGRRVSNITVTATPTNDVVVVAVVEND